MLTEKDGTFRALRSLISDRLIPAWLRADLVKIVLPQLPEASLDSPQHEFRSGMEVHPFVEICVCISGRAEMWCGPEVISLEEGEILVIPPSVEHSAAALHCITIAPEKAFSRLMWVSILPCGAVVGLCESRDRLHRGTTRQLFFEQNVSSCIFKLIQELGHGDDLAPLLAKCHLIEAFACISRGHELPLETHSLDSIRLPDSKPILENGIVSRARRLMHENYHSRLDLDTIARAAFTNKPRLCREFKKCTGLTIFEYLARLRVEASKRLLQTGLQISIIAELVGFQDPYYFSRVFKKITGLSPRKYQSIYRSDLERD